MSPDWEEEEDLRQLESDITGDGRHDVTAPVTVTVLGDPEPDRDPADTKRSTALSWLSSPASSPGEVMRTLPAEDGDE